MDWLEQLGWKPSQLDDLRALAYSYVKQGVYSTALTFFEALTAIAPLSAYDLQMVGALQLQLGRGQEALEALDRALKLAPTSWETQLNRAKALFMLGYQKQGLQQAAELQRCENESIATQAAALLLAYATPKS